MGKIVGYRFRSGASLLALTLVMAPPPAMAETAPAAHRDTVMTAQADPAGRYTFNIPAKKLLGALADFTMVTGIQVVRPDGEALDSEAREVSGAFTAAEALDRLLAGSRYTFRFTDARTVVLQAGDARGAGPTRLEPVTVEARRARPTPGAEAYAPLRASAGTKTDTPLDQVPASVRVVSRAVLDDQQALRVEEALRNVSSTVFVDGGEGKTFFSRGFSASLFVDNVLRTEFTDGDGYAGDLDSYNVERIEVLKGPSSVLYGRGNPGGTINIVTKRPLDAPAYEGRFVVGSHDRFRGAIDFTGPLHDEGLYGYRLNAVHEEAESFRDEVESKRTAVAPTFQWRPRPETTVLLDLDLAEIDMTPDVGIVRSGNGPLPGQPRSRFLGEPTDEFRSTKAQGRLRLEHDFSDALQLRSGLLYSHTRNEDYFTRGNALQGDGRTLTRSIIDSAFDFEDVNFQTDLLAKAELAGMRHRFVLGAEIGWRDTLSIFNSASAQSIDIFNPVYGNTGPTGAFSLFRQDTSRWTIGFYAQDQIEITSNVTLVLGARFDHIKQKGESGGVKLAAKSDHALSPRAGLVYKPIEPVALYAAYSKSFTPVNGFPLSFGGEVLEAERGELYEAGIKLDLLGDRVSTTLAVYKINRSNVGMPDLANPGFQVSSAEQESKGVEFEVAGELLPGWRVIGALGYTDAEIKKGAAATIGNRPAGIPKYSASLWSVYQFQEGAPAGFGFGGGAVYSTDRFGNVQNNFEVDGYTRLDLTAFYKFENWTARFSLQNALDAEYYLNPTRANFLLPGSPRSFLLSLQGSF